MLVLEEILNGGSAFFDVIMNPIPGFFLLLQLCSLFSLDHLGVFSSQSQGFLLDLAQVFIFLQREVAHLSAV